MDAWQRVLLARHTLRPTAAMYIEHVFDEFLELHGDKLYADDAAIIGGIATLDGEAVTVIGQEKGTDTKDRIHRNFGCAHPEGYRKSLRLMRQAEKFHRPVVCIVDTQGAFCGVGAEQRGMGEAIARNMQVLSALRTPVVCVLVGEGGSGGALALAVSDRIAMLENSVYSILSPEGFASILWKDATRMTEAAALMKMTAREVFGLGLVDAVIPELGEGAHQHPKEVAAAVGDYIKNALRELRDIPLPQLLEQRYRRIRSFGTQYIIADSGN